MEVSEVSAPIEESMTVGTPASPVPVAGNQAFRPEPRNIIDYPGRRLALLAVTPAGLFGIAVGATAVVLNLSDITAQIVGLSVVWGAATVVSILLVLTGMRESANYLRQFAPQPGPFHPTASASTSDEAPAETWPEGSPRYQSLKPVTADRVFSEAGQ
jgi:hypothetical protein